MKKGKIIFLNRYQDKMVRGAETFIADLSNRLEGSFDIKILSGQDADSLNKVIEENPDIVVPMNGRLQSLKVFLGRFRRKYKIVSIGQSGIGRDLIWNIVIGRPNVFVALTSEMESWAKRWSWGVKIITIPNGVDTTKFIPKGGKIDFGLKRPVILSVGALVEEKGHKKTIEAVSETNYSLIIVGQGPLEESLRSFGRKKLGDRFKLTSFSHQSMPDVYRSADLFVLPSWGREAFGIVYIEALASGLPVVATRDSTRKEIVGEGGILINPDKIENISRAISAAFKVDWGNKPLIQAEKFSWKIIGQKYSDLFNSLLEE